MYKDYGCTHLSEVVTMIPTERIHLSEEIETALSVVSLFKAVFVQQVAEGRPAPCPISLGLLLAVVPSPGVLFNFLQ